MISIKENNDINFGLFFKNDDIEELLFSDKNDLFFHKIINEKILTALGFFSGYHKEGEDYYFWRDPLGACKLYIYNDYKNHILVSESWIELVRKGCDLKNIYSLPKGKVIALKNNQFREIKNIKMPVFDGDLKLLQDKFDKRINLFYEKLNDFLAKNKIYKTYLALSGGLDSGLLLYYAADNNINFNALTLNMDGSEDAILAKKIAKYKNINHHIFNANEKEIKQALESAPLFCEDWRDFNVHCAAVNLLLAKEIKRLNIGKNYKSIIITGDFMNEYVCDYKEEFYKNNIYYQLPKIKITNLQKHLIKGMETSSREDRVFSKYSISTLQPYTLLADLYLSLNESLLNQNNIKQKLNICERNKSILDFISVNKLRAQVGSKTNMGILGLAVDNDFDNNYFQDIIAKELNLESKQVSQLIFGGKFRQLEFKKCVDT